MLPNRMNPFMFDFLQTGEKGNSMSGDSFAQTMQRQFRYFGRILASNPLKYFVIAAALAGYGVPAHGSDSFYELEIIIDKSANFEVVALKGDTVLWKSGKMGAKKNLFVAKIPRAKTKNATKFCVVLAKGWIVRDQAGKAYTASCDDFGSLPLMSAYELKVERQ